MGDAGSPDPSASPAQSPTPSASPGPASPDPAARLAALRAAGRVDDDEVSQLWDACAPATIADLAGSRWRGSGLDTGHPMFGMLGRMRWWGKDFTDPRRVDPILVTDDSGAVVPDTSATGGGGAALWEVSFRGRPCASMVYDRLPVIDHFVVVGPDPTPAPSSGADPAPHGPTQAGTSPADTTRPDTLLAVMNGRGTLHEGRHFWFVLEREG